MRKSLVVFGILLCCIVLAQKMSLGASAALTKEPRVVTNIQSRIDFKAQSLTDVQERVHKELTGMIHGMAQFIPCGNDESLVAFRKYVKENADNAIPALTHIALVTTNEKFQVRSLSALSELGSPKTTPFFRALASSRDPTLRRWTPRAFANIYTTDGNVIGDLNALLKDQSGDVRYSALHAVRDIKEQQLARNIAALFSDTDPKISLWAHRVWCDIHSSIKIDAFLKLFRNANEPGRTELLRHVWKINKEGAAGDKLTDFLLRMLESKNPDIRLEADLQLFLIRNAPAIRREADRIFRQDSSPIWNSVKTLGFAGWRVEQKSETEKTLHAQYLDEAFRAYQRALANYRSFEEKRKLQVNHDEGATLAYRIIRVYQKRGQIQEAVEACKALAEEFSASTRIYVRDYPVPGTNMDRTVKELTGLLLKDLKEIAQQPTEPDK